MGGACSDKVDIFSYGEWLSSLCHYHALDINKVMQGCQIAMNFLAELFICTGVLLWEIVTGQQPRRGQLRECR